jgi:phosphate starvation-inducible PhoH-like protein
MTRIGRDSRIVITGDIEQADRQRGDNGLLDLATRLEQHPVSGISVCKLESRDVQRHPLIGSVLKLYGQDVTIS